MLSELIVLLFFLLFLINFFLDVYFMSNFMFLISFLLIMDVDFFVEWIMISLNLSLNYYSYGLVLLTLWILSIVMMMMKKEVDLIFCLNILILMLIVMIMNFLFINIILFYLMFEISLVLIFLLIVKWGLGVLRVIAGYYLMFYTMFFSLPLLMILFNVVNFWGSESFLIMENLMIEMNLFLFIFMIMSFLVKFPMFMFHGWLLKAHVEAPVYGSMILAAIMLKIGSYGLLRFMMIFFINFFYFNFYLIEVSLIGSVILSLMCFRQVDMKILVAMSSVVHMGLMLSSMLTMFKLSFLGSYIMMISHGLCSSGLFYLLNLCYQETNSRLMIVNKGMMLFMPSMTLMWFLLCSSNMAAPFSLNLVGEIMLLISLVVFSKLTMIKLFMYCLFSFMYSLYFFSYINHGKSNFNMNLMNGKMINYLILLFHWIPLNLLIFNLNFLI